MSELQHNGDGSPFDAIRRVTPEGREYWSARELMPLLGYEKWERFADAIDRAKIAAHNSGYDVSQNFPAAGKVSGTRGPAQADYHLSRYACYLVAMSSDARKPEVAAALTYFAIKTREAETRPAELTEDQIVRKAMYILDNKVKELEAVIEEAAPKVAAYERFIDSDGTYSVGAVAKMLGRSQNKLFQDLRAKGVLIAKGAMRNTPYQRYMHHFAVKVYDFERTDGSTGTSYTTRVAPSGVEFISAKLGQPLLKSVTA